METRLELKETNDIEYSILNPQPNLLYSTFMLRVEACKYPELHSI